MAITITETPKVRYYEGDSNPGLNGGGAQIPIFIGITGNTSPTPGIQKFKSYTAAKRTIPNGGIGTDPTTNPLLAVLEDFFIEGRKNESEDIGIPYVYVIDLGTATVENPAPWLAAMELAKTKREIAAEIYVGFKQADDKAKMLGILKSALSSIKADNEYGNPRIAYYTVANATDAQLMVHTDDEQEVYVQDSRLALCEPKYFGRILAKIMTTPFYEEPGYTDFRSIAPGEFNNRTPAHENELQSAGIIFIKDELAGSEIHPRINLAVSTAFAASQDVRVNDCLLHARRNVDQLIREVYVALYHQIKRNETETNIIYCQTDVDVIVNKFLDNGWMMDGTNIEVIEANNNPYRLLAEGVSVPVNSTLFIGFSMYIEEPNAVSTGGN